MDDAEQRIEERAQFDIIRYANCWEDADILLKAIDVKEGGAYLSIASAGDNTFSILSGNPSLVLAVDISPAQLACVELKKAAFFKLSYEELVEFLGIQRSGIRQGAKSIITYRQIRDTLSTEARQFWDAHLEFIRRGIIHTGKFEGYFRLFRTWIMPLIHSKGMINNLLKEKDAQSRTDFYAEKWDTVRWRWLFKIFFSRSMMGRLGRDPEFFRYVEADVADKILERAKYALTALPTENNPYLEYILMGNFKRALPFYLRKNNFDKIRNNLDTLVVFKGSLVEALQKKGTLKFDGFNLSDIFEYMSYDAYIFEIRRIIDASKKGARLVYWNMLADRQLPEAFKDQLEPLDDFARGLFMQDKAFFYKALRIEQAR